MKDKESSENQNIHSASFMNQLFVSKKYREFNVNYDKFNIDLKKEEETIDTTLLIDKAKTFFKRKGLLLNWIELNKLENLQKINTLSMIAPIANEEKQKLLEAISLKEKIKVLENIIDFYLHEVDFNTQTIQ